MTVLMMFSLSLVALCINQEMTWCYGIGSTFMLAVWPMLIMLILQPKLYIETIASFFGVAFASVYIIIDTEKIMTYYGPGDEALYGALALYKDVIVLFISLLSILGAAE